MGKLQSWIAHALYKCLLLSSDIQRHSLFSITFLYIPIILELRNFISLLNVNKAQSKVMTGQELRQILIEKWGRSYDVQLRRTQGKLFLQVMWKYLEQASFPLDENEYLEHLELVANYLDGMGGSEQVQGYIKETRERPRLGKAVSVPLDLGERTSEWIL